MCPRSSLPFRTSGFHSNGFGAGSPGPCLWIWTIIAFICSGFNSTRPSDAHAKEVCSHGTRWMSPQNSQTTRRFTFFHPRVCCFGLVGFGGYHAYPLLANPAGGSNGTHVGTLA